MRVGWDKRGVFVKKFRRDGRHFYGIAIWCARANVAGQKKGDIHLVVSKDRVGVSSHLTPLSCKPLDR